MAEAKASASGRKRLFFALWPDDEVRAQLFALSRKALKRQGRKVPAENLHLTLAFLGSVGSEAQSCVESLADKLSGVPFTLEFNHLGYWPKPRVIWSGCKETPEALVTLVQGLRAGLKDCGIEPEARPYRAHLTLVRKASVPAGFGGPHAPVVWPVNSFHLLESKTLSTGAQYNIVRSWTL